MLDHFTFFGYIFSWDLYENKKIADEANKTTITSFSILAWALIVLLVCYIHMETST